MFSSFGYTEMLLFGVIAIMLFGSRLPEVARNFGGTYRELRRKVDDFQREFRDWDRAETLATKKPNLPTADETERAEPASPKFVPPPPDEDDE
jgi:sec-independent protein translocase protein TatA